MARKHAPKSLSPVDRAVGLRIRHRRLLLKMSQTDLGEKLNITFQQLQKYENGKNRVSAGRLQEIANALKVPVSTFFDDAAGKPDTLLNRFAATNEGIALMRAFDAIDSKAVRAAIVAVAVRTAEFRAER